MALRAGPILTRVYRHRAGIAQYSVGHSARLGSIEATLRGLPGLWVAGSSYYGVSMNACIQKAEEQANEILGVINGG
jgi:oxygen-dependent protoporphyrinogen oxidase